MKHLIILALLAFSATSISCAQSKVSQEEKFQSIYNSNKALIETQSYQFIGEWVFDNKKRRQLDTEVNVIKIEASTCSGQLKALNADKSIDISGAITNYKANFNDEKQQISIEFAVNGSMVYIDIKQHGSIFLTVKSSVNNISQVGKIKHL